MANVKISIISEFLGKGLKDADKSIKGFEKSVKQVGYLFGGGYLGAKVLSFSKVAVKAFAADDNAARSLGLTLKNLGLGYTGASKSVNDYISNLEKQTGVLDDELRPAMDRLLRATGSVAKSQDLLGLSLDIAAGTGKSLTQVSQSLQKAYLGQTQALGRLGVGLSKAELTSSSFETIQGRLTTLFKGQAVSAANSYQGSIDKLTVAMNNAKEIIGKGMVDALTGAGGGGGLQGALDAVAKSAQVVSDLFVGIGRTRAYLGELFTTKAGVSPLQAFKNAQALAAEFRRQDQFGGSSAGAVVPAIQTALANKAAEDYLKKLREEAKIANKLTKEKQKQLALDKAKAAEAKKKLALDQASAVLNKANEIFDNERMQLAAAMQGKLSEEDKVRVKLKQDILDLETAINEGNVSAAAKLASSVTSGAEQLGKMRGEMVNLSGIPNPFTAWLETLKLMTAELAKQAGLKSPITDFTITSGMSTAQKIATLEAQRQSRLSNPEYYRNTGMESLGDLYGTQQMPSIFGAGGIGAMPVVVNVNNAGSVISGGDLAEEMRAIFLNMDLSGSASTINRTVSSVG